MKSLRYLVAVTLLCFPFLLFSQSPGLIVRPQGGAGVTILNPNGDGYSSASGSAFTSNDITESEIAFKVVPAAITEPTGDISTGPTGGFSDIVTRVDGSGFYLHSNATNLFFRLRIGSIVSGAKGYSVLIDTDNKIGGSGSGADPNYVAPSGTNPGNPGFEYEVVFQTNTQVAVYSIDGTASPGAPATYSLNTNSQISVALSTDGNNPDYFYDWAIPLSAIGSPASIRTAVTTITSPNSAFQGTRSDIYGIDDSQNASVSAAWQKVVEAQPPINVPTAAINPVCTAAPALSGPIAAGTSVVVSGTWTRLDASKPSTALISLYKNGVLVNTSNCISGNTWNITVPSIVNGDVFYAKALATGESECLESNRITASACLVPPAAPVLTCASLKGISGTMPATGSGNSILVYLVPTTNASPASNLVSTGANLTYPTTTSFAYYTNGCSGGANNVATGVYMILTQNGSCTSSPVFVCINSGSSGTPPPLTTNALTLTTPIYATHTSISGSGATTGDVLRLYINGKYINSITTSSAAFSFTGLTLTTGDQIRIYSQTGTNCITQSNLFTVSCFALAPSINTNATGNLLVGATSISGTSGNPGASVQVYKGTPPSGVATGSVVTVSSGGNWSVTVPALIGGENYYAIQTVGGCASQASSVVTVLAPASCPSISGSYTDASTTVTGTMPSSFTGTIRLYLDGGLIGSQSISASTPWSIAVSAGILYYNGSLTATAQAAGGAESSGCASVTVGCTSPPVPSVSPNNTTITAGNTVTFAVSNVASGNWYALLDNSGLSYATSSYRTTSASFNMTTNTFNSPGTYNLKITADALTGCPLSFASATVVVNASLPLRLIGFSGMVMPEVLLFNWETTQEINVSHFELQESLDGVRFVMAGKQQASGTAALTHKYQLLLNRKLSAPVYYRLRIVDHDAKEQFSQVILLKPGKDDHIYLQASPLPFGNHLTITYTSDRADVVTLSLVDVSGKTVKRMERTAFRGINKWSMESLSELTSGLYFLVLTGKDGQRLVVKAVPRSR